MNRDKTIIEHILLHCSRICELTKNLSFEEFDKNQDIKEIVCFNELQIGELVKKLSEKIRQDHPEVPWRKIAGMRDHIVHGYDAIQYTKVYESAMIGTKNLEKDCKEILKGLK